MNKIADKFLERPLWQRVLFWIGSLGFVTYCFYYFLIKDSWEEKEQLSQKIEGLNKSIMQEQRIARDLNRYRQEVKDLEVKLKVALQELPDKREIPDLLTSISNLARDAGLAIDLFRPTPESRRDFYAEVPVSISVEGTFHQIASFFDEVGRLPRIVNITQIALRDPKVKEDRITVKGECVATTFRYLDESDRVQAAPEADQKHRRKK